MFRSAGADNQQQGFVRNIIGFNNIAVFTNGVKTLIKLPEAFDVVFLNGNMNRVGEETAADFGAFDPR